VQAALVTWRRKLFSTVIAGVALVVLGSHLVLGSVIALPFVFELPSWVWWFTPLAVIACWTSAFTFLTWTVKRVVAQRPGPAEPVNPDLKPG
jgi:hypothetical protein